MQENETLVERERWIIRRKKDGAILCGLAQNYKFKRPENIEETPIKTYRSERQALAAFAVSWGDEVEVEAVKVVEKVCLA